MSYRVVVTARARADAVQSFRWIADQSPDAAARWYVGLEKAIAKLTTMPERHPIAEDESEQLGMKQVGKDDAWRLVMALQVCEAVKMLEAHMKSLPSDGPGESGWTIRITR